MGKTDLTAVGGVNRESGKALGLAFRARRVGDHVGDVGPDKGKCVSYEFPVLDATPLLPPPCLRQLRKLSTTGVPPSDGRVRDDQWLLNRLP